MSIYPIYIRHEIEFFLMLLSPSTWKKVQCNNNNSNKDKYIFIFKCNSYLASDMILYVYVLDLEISSIYNYALHFWNISAKYLRHFIFPLFFIVCYFTRLENWFTFCLYTTQKSFWKRYFTCMICNKDFLLISIVCV